MQKGPEYFLAAAKKVLEVMDNVKFVMAGSGDMIRRTIEMAAAMGIGHKCSSPASCAERMSSVSSKWRTST